LRASYGDDFAALWEELGAGPVPEWLDGISQRAAATPQMRQFQGALGRYLEMRRAAADDNKSIAAWQAAVEAGEALLPLEREGLTGVNWDALRVDLAAAYTGFCIVYVAAGELEQSLAATDRAIALWPDVATWRCIRVSILIDLGRHAEAAEELERARALEPEAPRLAVLDAALARARSGAPAEESIDGE